MSSASTLDFLAWVEYIFASSIIVVTYPV